MLLAFFPNTDKCLTADPLARMNSPRTALWQTDKERIWLEGLQGTNSKKNNCWLTREMLRGNTCPKEAWEKEPIFSRGGWTAT